MCIRDSTYPAQKLDNDLCQAVVARGSTVFVRGQVGQDLDTAANVGVGDAAAQTEPVSYTHLIANGFPYAATNTSAYNQMLGAGEQGSLANSCANGAANGSPCVNPTPVAQLYNLPVPGGVDKLSNACLLYTSGDQEIFSTEEMIAAFDLPQIGRSPARFDFAKLESLNGHYIRQSNETELLAAIDQLLPHIANGAELAAKMTPLLRQQWLATMPSLKERAKTLLDIIDGAGFLLTDRPLPLDDKAKALLTPEARDVLRLSLIHISAM